MEMDFSGPPPQAKTLEEAQEIINVLWDICGKLTQQVKALESRCQLLEEENALLKGRVTELEEKLNTNSRNSSTPPSNDKNKNSNKDKPDGRKKKKRKPGGQPGHKGHHRALMPTEEVDAIEYLFPTSRCECGDVVLLGDSAKRHQVHELPEIKPTVTEYQLHIGKCCGCGKSHEAKLPDGVSWSMLGPRAMALVGSLSGGYRLSKRQIVSLLKDVYGLPISIGTLSSVESVISAALQQPIEELRTHIENQGVLHADETGHKQSGKKQWLWGAITNLASVFLVRKNRNQTVAKELLGKFEGILVSDRYGAYNIVESSRRQLCWAHLIRDFTKISERKGPSKTVGEILLRHTKELFNRWHEYKAGTIDRATLKSRTVMWVNRIESQLQLGATITQGKTKKTCKRILKQKEALWTFLHQEGVEPTNNIAEQMIRHYVIWRKQSFGTQSERGNRFIERIMSSVITCKQQNRNFLEYLQQAIHNHFSDKSAPSLIPDTA